MSLKMTLAALLLAPLALTACKKNEAPEQTAAASETAAVEEAVTAEQQAAIDAIDQPELDEKNKDIPAEVANAPADAATADPAVEASAATAH